MAQPQSDHVVLLTEVYRVSPTLPLQTYRFGNWTAGGGLTWPSQSLYLRRNNLNGHTVNVVHRKVTGNLYYMWGTLWRSWKRHYAKSQEDAVSITNGITGIFDWNNPSGRTMALGLTQPLIEMSTRNNSGGKSGRYVGLTTLPHSCADCLKIREPQPPGTLRTFQVCNGKA